MSAETLQADPSAAGKQLDPSLLDATIITPGEKLEATEGVIRLEHIGSGAGPLAVAQGLEASPDTQQDVHDTHDAGVSQAEATLNIANPLENLAAPDPNDELTQRPGESDDDYLVRLNQTAQRLRQEADEYKPERITGPLVSEEGDATPSEGSEEPDSYSGEEVVDYELPDDYEESAKKVLESQSEDEETDEPEEYRDELVVPPPEQPSLDVSAGQPEAKEEQVPQTKKEQTPKATELEASDYVEKLSPRARDIWGRLSLLDRNIQDGELSERFSAFRQSVERNGVFDREQALAIERRAQQLGQSTFGSLLTELGDYLPGGQTDQDVFRHAA